MLKLTLTTCDGEFSMRFDPEAECEVCEEAKGGWAVEHNGRVEGADVCIDCTIAELAESEAVERLDIEAPEWDGRKPERNPGDYYDNKGNEAAFLRPLYFEAGRLVNKMLAANVPLEKRGNVYETMVALKRRLESAEDTGD
jgi:hypothetical protein